MSEPISPRDGILSRLRKIAGFTQAEVAEKMGITPSQAKAIETQPIEDCELRIIIGYVEALGADLSLAAEFGSGNQVLYTS